MIKRIATLLLGIGLIGLGVLFFIAPQGSIAIQFLIRFWPVFLILAGIVRVAGYLIDRHPKSPVEGMLITAVGGILLSANLLGHHSLLLLLGKYWFWLLLALVAGRVMKQTLHRKSDGVIRPRAFAPAAIAGMILLVASGLLANYVARNGRQVDLRLGKFGEVGDYIFGSELTVEDQPARSLAIAPNARLRFNNLNGDIEIHSAPQAQATVRVLKRVRAATEEDAKEIARNILLHIASEGRDYQFSIGSPGREQDFSATILVTLPQQVASHLEINNPLGHVKLSDLRGDLRIRGGKRIEVQRNRGRVEIENPEGEVELKQIEDDVSVSNAHHPVTLQNIAGNISLDISGSNLTAENLAGSFSLRASDAQIALHHIGGESGQPPAQIEFSEARNCRIDLREITGTVAITAEHSRIEAKGVNGDFRVENSGERIIASRLHGSLQIKAKNGAVELEEIYGPTTIEADRDITVNGFYDSMEVNSEHGTISLKTGQKLNHDLTATCQRGQIKVSIPHESLFRLEAGATRGRIRMSGFEQITLHRNERSAVLGYNFSDSSPLVSLHSGKGDIQFQSSGLAPAAIR